MATGVTLQQAYDECITVRSKLVPAEAHPRPRVRVVQALAVSRGERGFCHSHDLRHDVDGANTIAGDRQLHVNVRVAFVSHQNT